MMSQPILQTKPLSLFDAHAVEECLKWFPTEQAERITGFSNLSRKIEAAASYSLLVEMLRSNGLLKELPSIEYAEGDKPYMKNYPEMHFNLSHCRRYVAVAIHSSPVGVDIECRRKVSQSLIKKVCSEDEQQSIAAAQDPDMEFLRLWTRKESYLKYTGTGIVEPLTGIPPQLSSHIIKTHPLPEGDGWVSICF
jgi:4'-phosphopantetheinyl transferase